MGRGFIKGWPGPHYGWACQARWWDPARGALKNPTRPRACRGWPGFIRERAGKNGRVGDSPVGNMFGRCFCPGGENSRCLGTRAWQGRTDIPVFVFPRKVPAQDCSPPKTAKSPFTFLRPVTPLPHPAWQGFPTSRSNIKMETGCDCFSVLWWGNQPMDGDTNLGLPGPLMPLAKHSSDLPLALQRDLGLGLSAGLRARVKRGTQGLVWNLPPRWGVEHDDCLSVNPLFLFSHFQMPAFFGFLSGPAAVRGGQGLQLTP